MDFDPNTGGMFIIFTPETVESYHFSPVELVDYLRLKGML